MWTRTTRPRSAGPWRSSAIELIAAYSPQARGRNGAHVRDLAEAPAPGAAPRRDRHHGRGQSLSRGALLAGAQRPLRPPGRGHRLGLRGFCRHARGHPLRPGGPRRRGRQHRALQEPHAADPGPIATATTTSRRRSGCTNIPTATWPSSTDPGVWRATAPTAKPSTTTGSRPRDPLRRDRARACG